MSFHLISITSRLFIPLVLLEVIIYILFIAIGFFVVRSRWQYARLILLNDIITFRKNGSSIAVELLLVTPALFVYLNWTLFEELYDKNHKVVRLEAILKRI